MSAGPDTSAGIPPDIPAGDPPDASAGHRPDASAAGAFLRRHGFGAARLDLLPGDAGRRRYTRLRGGPRPALLMDCSAEPASDLVPFLAVGPHLAAGGLSVPAVLARDEAAGLLLVEDLGEYTHAALLDAGTDPVPLYAAAGRALAALHAVPPPPGLPRWNGEAMARAAAATFLDWWWPLALGAAPDAAARRGFERAVRDTAAPFEGAAALVHRDWFPANLTRAPGRTGLAAVGVLDFQDAALGHPAYDLVSLVEDARRDVPDAARAAALSAYAAAGGAASGASLVPAMAALGAVRHLRVAALWVRLARRDGKPAYLRHGPRCWRLLGATLAHPAAAPLAGFLDAHVPAAARGNPPAAGAA